MTFLEHQVWCLKVITPVHIGWGDSHKLGKLDIVHTPDNHWAIPDERKWAEFVAKKGLLGDRDFLEFAQQSSMMARPAQTPRQPPAPGLTEFLKRKKFEQEWPLFKAYLLKCSERPGDLHLFIKNGDGHPYIPGSSLKGVLRTALMYHLILKSPQDRERIRNSLEKEKGTPDWLLREPGISDAGDESLKDVMRAVRVSDSDPLGLPGKTLMIARKCDYNLHKSEEQSHKLFRECLQPKETTRFVLTVDMELLKRSTPPLFKDAADLYAIIVEYGQALFKEFADECARHPAKLDLLPNPSENPNLCLGGGTGFQTKVLLKAIFHGDLAGYMAAKIRLLTSLPKGGKRDNDKFAPRTIKLDRPGGQMLGWCHLSQE